MSDLSFGIEKWIIQWITGYRPCLSSSPFPSPLFSFFFPFLFFARYETLVSRLKLGRGTAAVFIVSGALVSGFAAALVAS